MNTPEFCVPEQHPHGISRISQCFNGGTQKEMFLVCVYLQQFKQEQENAMYIYILTEHFSVAAVSVVQLGTVTTVLGSGYCFIWELPMNF